MGFFVSPHIQPLVSDALFRSALFGVKLTRLHAGSISAVHHARFKHDEPVYGARGVTCVGPTKRYRAVSRHVRGS